MTHFGIICPAAAGHLNPMTTLGYELKKQGHRVTVVGILDAQAKTQAAGLEFQVLAEDECPLGTSTAVLAQLGQLKGFAALRYTIDLFKQATSMLLQQAPAVIQQSGIEALLIDQTSFGATTVAERLDIPFITVCNALMINREPNIPPFNTSWSCSPSLWARLRNQMGYHLLDRIGRPITQLVADCRQQWNLPPYIYPEDRYSKLAQLSQQPAEFEFPRQQLPQSFHFTGPYHNPVSREPAPFPFDKLTGQPLIYASMGTVQNRLMWVFEAIADACADLDVQLVIALGGGSTRDALPDLPGSPLVVEYAPQLELLQRATLTITHAGMNTALESLSNGVPMVAIPIANDQPGVASRIVWTGTGKALSLKRLTVAQLRQAITTVLTEESYKTNALRLQRAIQDAGGTKQAVEIIEHVMSSGQPLSR